MPNLVTMPSKCRATVYPTLGSVNSRGTGCGECSESGFKSSRPALVYLLTHKRLNAAKIGICNVGTDRIAKHRRRGWTSFQKITFANGADAARLEREVLAEWRTQGWRRVLDGGKGYDGWTETVELSGEVTPEGLWGGVEDLHVLVC